MPRLLWVDGLRNTVVLRWSSSGIAEMRRTEFVQLHIPRTVAGVGHARLQVARHVDQVLHFTELPAFYESITNWRRPQPQDCITISRYDKYEAYRVLFDERNPSGNRVSARFRLEENAPEKTLWVIAHFLAHRGIPWHAVRSECRPGGKNLVLHNTYFGSAA